jgi:hypothetical protein
MLPAALVGCEAGRAAWTKRSLLANGGTLLLSGSSPGCPPVSLPVGRPGLVYALRICTTVVRHPHDCCIQNNSSLSRLARRVALLVLA